MERIFHLKENGTSVKTEILAGLTTFMTMAYIIALNPNLLTNFAVGTPLWNGVFLAACIASAIGTVVMAFLANKPFVMAPGMALNSFFAVIAGNVAAMLNTDYTSAFQAVLCIILVEGIVFLLLSIFNIRDKIVTAIPLGVRLGIGPAIGLMLMNIGLGSNVGIYAEGNGYTSPFYVMRDFFGAMTPSVIKDHMGAEYSQMVLTVVTMFIGLFVIILLAKKGVKAAVLVGMLVASVIYWAGCFIFLGTNPFASLEGASFLPPFHDMVETTLFKFDFTDFFNIGWFTAISLIITFCMIDMFDTIGTLVGTASRAGMTDKDGNMPKMKEALLSAAVGTVADVMPLTGENRTLVKAGLKLLQQTDRPGISALLEEVGLEGKPVTAENVSYAIAPRINAAGRMDIAVTALQLVLCEDEERAAELAHKLNEINVARQETEQEIVKAAQEQLDAEPAILEDRVILIWGRDWHPGVIGIVASRLVEKTGRPVIVVSVDEHGEGKGSGRSVQGFNLHECIASCADILLRFGGHAMAAGLSVREEDLQTLRQRLNDWAARECPVLRTPPLECDLSVHLDRLTVESVRRLDQLAPYGAANPSPVFVLEMAVVEGVNAVSEGKHCRLRLRQGNSSIYAVWFGMHPEQVPYSTGDVVDAAISLSVYDSPRGAQLSGRIIELHPAGLGNTAAEQAALVQALRRGTPLTPEQKESIAPERSHIITVYRELQARHWHAEDLQPLFAKLGEENTGRTLVAVAALEQVGLITAADRGGAKFWELVPATGKKNLADAPILKCLEER